MHRQGKILTFLFIIVMMVNTVGIAQVSHFCKLAAGGKEQGDCHKTTTEIPPCCPSETGCDKPVSSKNSDCCTDVIKYFQQKVNTTLQPSVKVYVLNFFISLLIIPVPLPEITEFTSFINKDDFYTGKTGKSIILDIRTLLI